jgi:hypothetical protein
VSDRNESTGIKFYVFELGNSKAERLAYFCLSGGCLEAYELWQANAFEWIINIPVRRGRYDRILVRGIEGKAELRDVLFQVLKETEYNV